MGKRIAWGLMALLLNAAAQAEVKSANANGFDLEYKIEIKAPPERVYDALADIGRWWNPEHTYSGDAARLHLDAKAGGCFCESLADGGSVQHGTVVFAQRPRLLRFDGALGPLQSMGVSAVMSWALAPASGGTTLQASYRVGGYSAMPFEQLGPGVDEVLAEQLQRLKSYVERGKPD